VTAAQMEEWVRDRLPPAAVPKEWRLVPRVAGKLD